MGEVRDLLPPAGEKTQPLLACTLSGAGRGEKRLIPKEILKRSHQNFRDFQFLFAKGHFKGLDHGGIEIRAHVSNDFVTSFRG